MPTVTRQHFLIIGSGLVGRLLAWRLLVRGHRVDLVSADNEQGEHSAGWIAAAMIAPVTEAIQTELVVKEIGKTSLAIWPRWLAELPSPIYYRSCGTLVVAHPGDHSEMQRFEKRANAFFHDEVATFDSHQLAQVEPELAERFPQALYFQDEAWLDNRQLYQTLTQLLDDHQQCRWVTGVTVETVRDTALSALTRQHFNQSLYDYASIIDCRGNGAQVDLPDLRSVRGEVIRVHAPEVALSHAIRLLHPRFPLYLAPRPNHEYVLGATSIESEDMSPVSVRSGLELLSALYSLHTGFAEARILDMAAHCRPAMPDNLPVIKRTDWGYQINGLYRHGYLFSPAILTDFLAMLLDNTPIHQLQFGRFYDV